MKQALLGLFILATLNIFAEDIVCDVKLLDIKAENILAEREIRQNTSGMSAGTIAGADFFIEANKKKLFKKIPSSVISFSDVMNGWDNSTTLQFVRRSEPNRYGILTKSEAVGREFFVLPGEHLKEQLDDKYKVDIRCRLESEED